jgi:N-acetylglucosamine transport system permease protein
VAPAAILFAIFMLVPTFNVFRLSLFQRSTFNPNETFIAFKNFQMLMEDTTFIRSMQNMLLLIVMVTIFTMGTALLFAGILTREKLRGNGFFRVVFYIPNILSVVVISGIFSAIYDVDKGLLNSILNLFGQDGVLWKGEQHVIISLIIAMVWQAIGY